MIKKIFILIMGGIICFDDERVSGESDSTADSILTGPCDQMEEGA